MTPVNLEEEKKSVKMQFELMIDQDQNPAEWLIPAHISFSLVVTTRPLLYAISFTTVNYFSKVETHISRVLIWDQEVNFHLSLLSVRPIEPVSCFSFIKCRKKAKLLSKEKFILLRVETLFFFYCIFGKRWQWDRDQTKKFSFNITALPW